MLQKAFSASLENKSVNNYLVLFNSKFKNLNNY
jgi:hypothetical protein